MDKVTGYVTGVNGNLVAATFSGSVRKNEVGYVQVGDDRLKGEVIRVNGDTASMQIYEMTNGIQVGVRVSTHNTALIENYPARAILFAQGKIREVDLKAELG